MKHAGVSQTRSWGARLLGLIVSLGLMMESIASASVLVVGNLKRSVCLLHPLKQDCQFRGIGEFQKSSDRFGARPKNYLKKFDASGGRDVEVGRVSDDPQRRAQYWFMRGKELGQAGYFYDAAEAFRLSSIGAGPEFAATAWYNRALALDHGEDRLMAAVGFRDYLRYLDSLGDAGDDVANKVTPRSVAQSRIEELRPFLATLELRILGNDPREIWVNGEIYRISDFPLWVPEGRVELWVIDQVGKKQRSAFHISSGETRQLEVETLRTPTSDELLSHHRQADLDVGQNLFHRENSLQARNIESNDLRSVSVEGAGRDSSRENLDRPLLRTLFWATGSAALATGGLAIYAATETMRYKKRFESKLFNSGKCAPNCVSSQIEPFPSQYEQQFYGFRRATNVLLSAALSIAIGTAILGYFSFRRPKQNQKTTNLWKKAWVLSTN